MALLRYDASGIKAETIGSTAGVNTTDYVPLKQPFQSAAQAIKHAHDSGRLGFMACLDENIDAIMHWSTEIKTKGFTDQVVLGIGGSSLGTRAILESTKGQQLTGLRTHFSENIDPISVASLFRTLPLETTLFIVVTKSGTTIETMGQFWIAYDLLTRTVGGEKARHHFIAITDPEKGILRELAQTMGFKTFDVPSNVGGRFSVLTPVGLVPLVLAGYPINELLKGALCAREHALGSDNIDSNPLLRMAADQFLLYERGIDQLVMMAYSDQLFGLVDWFRQLWAESLGKAKNRRGELIEVGITPIKALGVIDQHSQVQLYMEGPKDKQILFLEVEDFGDDLVIPSTPALPDSLSHLSGKSLSQLFNAELVGTRAALSDAGRPTLRLIFKRIEPQNVGYFILAWEYITAIMGELFDINAFDQPGVELGKKIAHGLLGKKEYEQFVAIAGSFDGDNTLNGEWEAALIKD